LRKYPERPVVGVGAIVVSGESVALVKRAHEPLKGQWSLPGGAVEVGETLVEALEREVQEETGLRIRVGPVVEILDRVHRGADGRVEYHFVLIDYLCSVTGGALAPGSDAADVCWAAIIDLPKYHLADPATTVIAKALELARRSF
jgi:ADP-ribose pyrophosphatase YjhB (NUDIX family)